VGPGDPAPASLPAAPPTVAPSDDPAAIDPTVDPRAMRDRIGPLRRRLTAIALRPVYALYVRRLRAAVHARPRPRHVAVIMDGNRRWALREGHGVGVGHRAGAAKALELVDWCADLGIPEVTLWALSVENLGRDPGEVGAIADVAAEAIGALTSGRRRTKLPLRIRVIGRRDALPDRLAKAVEESAALSVPDGAMTVTIALAYSGRDELIEAFRATVAELAADGIAAADLPARLTADGMAAHLYTRGSSDPDLIIRTSGEVRLSGFLPWQSAYSEFDFSDAYWPAYREIDFLRSIRTYQQRTRRFGR
jgi:short-chain Z-isoprenyl diphosphate synthase